MTATIKITTNSSSQVLVNGRVLANRWKGLICPSTTINHALGEALRGMEWKNTTDLDIQFVGVTSTWCRHQRRQVENLIERELAWWSFLEQEEVVATDSVRNQLEARSL